VPDEIRDILASRYSFLVCEKEAFAEYSVEFQSCKVCSTWASPPDSVRCRCVAPRSSLPLAEGADLLFDASRQHLCRELPHDVLHTASA
jgi:hypothetical protein